MDQLPAPWCSCSWSFQFGLLPSCSCLPSTDWLTLPSLQEYVLLKSWHSLPKVWHQPFKRTELINGTQTDLQTLLCGRLELTQQTALEGSSWVLVKNYRFLKTNQYCLNLRRGYTHLRSILWENRIKGKHLRRNFGSLSFGRHLDLHTSGGHTRWFASSVGPPLRKSWILEVSRASVEQMRSMTFTCKETKAGNDRH